MQHVALDVDGNKVGNAESEVGNRVHVRRSRSSSSGFHFNCVRRSRSRSSLPKAMTMGDSQYCKTFFGLFDPASSKGNLHYRLVAVPTSQNMAILRAAPMSLQEEMKQKTS